MLFRKKIPRSCSYCIHGTKMNEEQLLCIQKGITDINSSCRKFRYDPCKRIPLKMKTSDFSKHDQDDYTL